ncbi:hypothetical protein [Cupriavidus necator]|uniref:hypothetical protein n=1 Tax=Cupriavidus necator TaxID=106590 RepID=UPI0015F47EAB|nr:hypothetical protein [Cupriavidus necator]
MIAATSAGPAARILISRIILIIPRAHRLNNASAIPPYADFKYPAQKKAKPKVKETRRSGNFISAISPRKIKFNSPERVFSLNLRAFNSDFNATNFFATSYQAKQAKRNFSRRTEGCNRATATVISPGRSRLLT